MIRATRLELAILAALPLGLSAGTASAEAPNAHATPVYVLSLSTDDVDDQADGLTLALRSRVREAQGWSLLESPQSFQTLALALKCPPRPDPTCLQRVADQLHADHYVWGKVAHKKGAPEVMAELHLWSRSKGDAEITTSFSDDLRDGSDPSLRKVAFRAFGKLTGTGANGTLIVHAGGGTGSVIVDGEVKGRLDSGVARVDVTEGRHKVLVRVSGFDAKEQDATIVADAEADVSFILSPEQPTFEDIAASTAQSFPVHKALGYSAAVIGAGLLVGAGIGAALWDEDYNKSNNDREHVPTWNTNVCTTQADGWAAYAEDACKASKDAKNASTAAWGMGIAGVVVGGTGLILLATDHSSTETLHEGKASPSVDVLPGIGRRSGGVDVRLTF